MDIRTLRADEIDARVQTVKENGCSILLYKDARCDMKVLDETFGMTGWQRHHEVINGNLFCNVGVKTVNENGFSEWVWKQDVGTESMADKEKGEASDSFKRACFNWGIGRELYTAPFVWIRLESGETFKGNNGKLGVKTRFVVTDVGYNDNREINRLEIKDDKGKVRYSYSTGKKAAITTSSGNSLIVKGKTLSIAQVKRFYTLASIAGINEDVARETVNKKYGVEPIQMTKVQYDEVCKSLEAKKCASVDPDEDKHPLRDV